MAADRIRRTVLLAAMGAAAFAGPARAGPDPGAAVRIAPGARYGAGPLHRFLFGSDYRALWTTAAAVPVLDLAAAGGGLTPTTAGGRFQTRSLRFRGADGWRYGFRSVDKVLSVLPPEFAGTFIEDLVSDQTSSQHPYAPAVTAQLMEAAGIPHTDPRLVVLPDDPRLGEFREGFAGVLGFFERRATVEPGRPGFAGAVEIIDSDELLRRTQRGPADRVDLRAFLRARLFDLLVGDWDRHRGQWTWARLAGGELRTWIPLPEDRDQAFARYDGLLLGVARLGAPFLLDFGPRYGDVEGATWNGRDLDRRFLGELDRAEWAAAATALAARLGDAAIDEAVRALPPEAHALDGERLARDLKARRDALGEEAMRFYDLVLDEASLHATDASERVVVDRHPDGRVEVSIAERGAPEPYLRRVFDPAATRDLRLFLHGGEDEVLVRGQGTGMAIRIVGGGRAALVDRSGDGQARFYAQGDDRAVGPSPTAVDRRADVGPPPPRPYESYRDWGSFSLPMVWASFGPDLGLFAGGGLWRTNYAFRKYPYASRLRLRAGWAFGATTGRADLDAVFHEENSRVRLTLYARASGIEVVKYHGLGNETGLSRSGDFYRVRQQQYLVLPGIAFPLGDRGELRLGAAVELAKTREGDGRIVDLTRPYGAGDFGQLGARARLAWDSRDREEYPTRGLHASVTAGVVPAVWDVASPYGFVEAFASAYLTAAGAPLGPTLALRAGGRRVWGRYPFFAAAFLGDAATVRLGDQNRFGGDASLYGNAELRLRLTRFFVILPGELGTFGLADAGRVFLAGETSGRWHAAFGGGVWLSVLRPDAVLSVAVASGEGRTALYIGSGMAF